MLSAAAANGEHRQVLSSDTIRTGHSAPDLLPATLPESLAVFLRFDHPGPFSCLWTWLPPVFIQHGIELKSFIRSRAFRQLRMVAGDRMAMDAIYVRAMQLTDNNTAVALFLAATSCFDHRMFGIKNPVLSLFFPLSNESEDDFNRRLRNLPARLYADTPDDISGDRDKPQHFFGSAFLTYISESRDAAERIGNFVEVGEDAVIIGGVDDVRDRRTNRQGQRFGSALFENNLQYPSRYLKPVPRRNLPGQEQQRAVHENDPRR